MYNPNSRPKINYTTSTIGGNSVVSGASVFSTGSMLKQEALAKAVRRNQRVLAQTLGLFDSDQSRNLADDLQTTIAGSMTTSNAVQKDQADLLKQVFDRIRSFNPLEYEINRQQNGVLAREDTDITRRQARNVLNIIDEAILSRSQPLIPCNYLYPLSAHIGKLAEKLTNSNQNSTQVFDQLPGTLHLFSLVVPANSAALIRHSFTQYSHILLQIAPYINNVHIGNSMVIIIAHILKSLNPSDWKVSNNNLDNRNIKLKSHSIQQKPTNSTSNSTASLLFQVLLSAASSPTPSIRNRTKTALSILIKSIPTVLHPLLGSHLIKKIQFLYTKLITDISSLSNTSAESKAKSDALNNILDLLPQLLPSMTNLFSARRFKLESTFTLLFSFLSSHARLAVTPISLHTMKAITALAQSVEKAQQISLDDEPLISFDVLFQLFQENLNINQNLSVEFRQDSVTQHTIMICSIYSLLHKLEPAGALEPTRFGALWTLLLNVYATPIPKIAKTVTPAIKSLMSSIFDQSLIMAAYNIAVDRSASSTTVEEEQDDTASTSSGGSTTLAKLLTKKDPLNSGNVDPDSFSRIENLANQILESLKLQNKPVWRYLLSIIAHLYYTCGSKSAIILKQSTIEIAKLYGKYFEELNADDVNLDDTGSTSAQNSLKKIIIKSDESSTNSSTPEVESPDIQLRNSFKKTMGAAIANVGVSSSIQLFETCFNVDPLNPKFQGKSGWTWLIPLFRDYAKHVPLSFFISYFLPILSNIQKYIQQTTVSLQKAKKPDQKFRLKQKMVQWNALWMQIWSCLPNFCSSCPDLEQGWPSLAPVIFSQIRSPNSSTDFIITMAECIQRVCSTLTSEDAKTLFPDPLALSLLVCQSFDLPSKDPKTSPKTIGDIDDPSSRVPFSLGGFPALFTVLCNPNTQNRVSDVLKTTISQMANLVSFTLKEFKSSPIASNRDFVSFTYHSIQGEPQITYSASSIQSIFIKFIFSAISKFKGEIPTLQHAMFHTESLAEFRTTPVVIRSSSLLALLHSLGTTGNHEIMAQLFSIAEFILWNNGINATFPLPSGGKFSSNSRLVRRWISLVFSRPAWRLVNLALSNTSFIQHYKPSTTGLTKLSPWEHLIERIINTPIPSEGNSNSHDTSTQYQNHTNYTAGENTRLSVYLKLVSLWPQDLSNPQYSSSGKPEYQTFDPLNSKHSLSLESFKSFIEKIIPDILFSLESNRKSRHIGFNLLVDIPYTIIKMVNRNTASPSASLSDRTRNDIQVMIKQKRKQAFKDVTSATTAGDVEEEEDLPSTGLLISSDTTITDSNNPIVHIVQFIELLKVGWAGSTVDMTSSTILAIMRVLNEFGYLLPDPVVASLFESIQTLLQKQDREIIRACFQFIRICFVCLPRRHMSSSIDQFIPLVLAHSLDSHLRRQARIVIERYIKKFTIHPITKCLYDLNANETHFKFVNKIASDLRRAQSKKASDKLLDGSSTSRASRSLKSTHMTREEKRTQKRADKDKKYKEKIKDVKRKHEAKIKDAPQFDVHDILLDSRGRIHVHDIERIKGIRKQKTSSLLDAFDDSDDDSWDDDDEDEDWVPPSVALAKAKAGGTAASKTKSAVSVPISQSLVVRSKRRLETLADPTEIASLDVKYDRRKRKRRY